MAVTPVRTGPFPICSLPSPEIRVVWPTSTPFTSVIALLAPGVPSKGTPRSRARGLVWAEGGMAEVREIRVAVGASESGLGRETMDAWKKALLMASLSAAAVLFLKKRYPAGVLATGVSLAMLASEYPEQFERVRQSLPDYFERGMRA